MIYFELFKISRDHDLSKPYNVCACAYDQNTN